MEEIRHRFFDAAFLSCEAMEKRYWRCGDGDGVLGCDYYSTIIDFLTKNQFKLVKFSLEWFQL